jgi:hypothetical protein
MENQTVCNSASELRDGLSLLGQAAECRRLGACQPDDNTMVTLLALAVENELRADNVTG